LLEACHIEAREDNTNEMRAVSSLIPTVTIEKLIIEDELNSITFM